MRKRKCATAVSIIGGADGPTSVFLAGNQKENRTKKEKHPSFHQKRKQYKKNKKWEKTKKQLRKIGIVSHTAEELEEYICTKYGAMKIGEETEDYKRAIKSTKTNLLFHFYKDLLPEHPALPKESLPQALEEYAKKIQAWFQEVEEIPLPEEICFRYYKIEVSNGKSRGEIFLEMELKHQVFFISSSYSDDNRTLFRKIRKVIEDIYLFYGVTEEDMQKNSERFVSLDAILRADDDFKKHKKGKKGGWLWKADVLFSVIFLVKWLRKRKIRLFQRV